MKPFNSDENLFVYDQKKWKEICEKDYCIPEPPSVTELENGIILPLKRRTDKSVRNFLFEGGVCDKNGQFIAGLRRHNSIPDTNLSCERAYALPPNIKERHETVVFCGILFGHFGHLISDGFARLWWFADHPDTQYKLVFLDAPVFGGFKYYNILEAAGITKDRMEIISEPTKFDKIIVPQESLNMLSNFRPGMGKIYDHIRSRVTPGPYKKVYLSRSALERQDTVNEQYFENFYKLRGFEIIHPELLPFTEQVSIMAGANEVVLVTGSLSQLTQFCIPNTKITILNRSVEKVQSINCCLQGKGADYCIIDAHFNFFPAQHSGGAYFLGPTSFWKEYLDKKGIPYDPYELSLDLHLRPFVLDYVLKWGKLNADAAIYNKNIHNAGLVDVVDKVNNVFFNTSLKRKDFILPDSVIKLKQENENLKNKVAILESLFKDALIEISQSHPEVLQNISKDLKLND